MPVMSYDLAVWRGRRPTDHFSAANEFDERMDRPQTAPAKEIAEFLAELIRRYPDTGPAAEDSPWASTPLTSEVCGDLVYIPISVGSLDAVVPFVAEVAMRHGLVCFDPQQGAALDGRGLPDAAIPRTTGALSYEDRVRKEWFASKRGFRLALAALDRTVADLPRAPEANRAAAACVAWHTSTSGATVPEETARTLADLIADRVRQSGWIGDVRICHAGDHVLVTDRPSHGIDGCADTITSFRLSDLHAMGRAAGDL